MNIVLTNADLNDIPHLLNIEYDCYDIPWDRSDFLKIIKQGNLIIARDIVNRNIAGYVAFARDSDKCIEILSVAVAPNYRKNGIGRLLVNKILNIPNSLEFYTDVRETNLVGQLFFKSLGFRCTDILPNAYSHVDEPAYFFILIKNSSTEEEHCDIQQASR